MAFWRRKKKLALPEPAAPVTSPCDGLVVSVRVGSRKRVCVVGDSGCEYIMVKHSAVSEGDRVTAGGVVGYNE